MSKNSVTTAPAQADKVHGFAITLRSLRQESSHDIRFISGQEATLLFDFAETGNPIDIRPNFQRRRKHKLPISFPAAADRAGLKMIRSRLKKSRQL
ncbi:hypothetical protein PHMEG_00026086 [Phytophthora megakarya]|uniref:Uncharacterized protein n=1 Tax=Phytophthora megakarya TaxID=4795 RepID=A0A225VB90_9STRA|nr:hypothetical protein PHMEG_00026086 [Phytophthora megakarya]